MIGANQTLSGKYKDALPEIGLSESDYKAMLIKVLKEPMLELFSGRSLPEEHDLFLDQLARHLASNDGLLMVDDLNTRIRQFNNCKWIMETIRFVKRNYKMKQAYMR